MSKQITRNIRVQLYDTRMVYSSYVKMAAAMKLRNYRSHDFFFWEAYQYAKGTVVTIKKHPDNSALLAGVRLDIGEDVIIAVDGLRFL